jgi:hypothetical protein
MATVQSGYGRIRMFTDFMGAEIPVANAVAYGTTAGGCNYYLGDFAVKGDLAETDTGVVALSKANGWARLSGNDENGKGVSVGTEICLSPALNGTIVLETRVEMAALTARVVWMGLCGTHADDVAEPLTGSTATLTLTADNLCGFVFDSQLTAVKWHMPYKGGTTTGPTASASVQSTVTPVAAEADVLRLEVAPDGRARWYINGNLEQEVAGAVSTSALQSAFIAVFGTTTTAADGDFDYFAVEANRDWTR